MLRPWDAILLAKLRSSRPSRMSTGRIPQTSASTRDNCTSGSIIRLRKECQTFTSGKQGQAAEFLVESAGSDGNSIAWPAAGANLAAVASHNPIRTPQREVAGVHLHAEADTIWAAGMLSSLVELAAAAGFADGRFLALHQEFLFTIAITADKS